MRCLALAVSLFLSPVFVSSAVASEWYIEPRLSVAASSRLHGSDTLTSQLNSAGLKLEYFSDELTLNVDGELQYDAVYDLTNQYSQAARDEYATRLWLDEAFFAWWWAEWEFNLGYQKVVWGEADDLRITDVVNPLDFKDFVLFDIDEYRISQSMLRTESTVSDWDVELLWLFQFEPNQLPPNGSEFSLVDTQGVEFDEPNEGELGVRASSSLFDADISFYGFLGYQDNPVVTTDGQRFKAEYYDQRMLGNSLSFSAGDFVIRTELAWFYQQSYGTKSLNRSEHNTSQGLLGIDYLYKDWLITGQATDRYIQGWSDTLTAPRSDAMYTLSAEGSLLAGKLTARAAASYADSLGGGELYQIKLAYLPSSHWKWQFNIDLLEGDERNLFGQFDEKDRIWISTTYYL